MKCCSKCFKKTCRCGRHKIEIDYYIYPAIYELNRKGYSTSGCCSGHEDSNYLRTSISFHQDIDTDIVSDFFQFDSYNYRGFHERRNCICVKPEIVKLFKKKRTNKVELIQRINKSLYEWAQSLPDKLFSFEDIIRFPTDYFDAEIEREEVVDIQKPWMLCAKATEEGRYAVADFFDEIECTGELTEILVNKSGLVKTFYANDYASYRAYPESSRALTEKILFDVSGDYKYLVCGYEPYATIEKLRIRDAAWYLAYARTDLASEYGDDDNADAAFLEPILDEDTDEDCDDEYFNKKSNKAIERVYTGAFFDEDDIADLMDEYPDDTDLDLFSRLFSRMCRMNIHICVFSADNVNIVFSNQTDFSVLMTDKHRVIALGEADYEYMDFPRIHVERKEVFVYANGRLLMRKDVE